MYTHPGGQYPRHGDRMDLNRIELWTLADNDRAIRMYERCGFVQEGVLPERSFKEGRWVDHVFMSVTRDRFAHAWSEWSAGQPR